MVLWCPVSPHDPDDTPKERETEFIGCASDLDDNEAWLLQMILGDRHFSSYATPIYRLIFEGLTADETLKELRYPSVIDVLTWERVTPDYRALPPPTQADWTRVRGGWMHVVEHCPKPIVDRLEGLWNIWCGTSR